MEISLNAYSYGMEWNGLLSNNVNKQIIITATLMTLINFKQNVKEVRPRRKRKQSF